MRDHLEHLGDARIAVITFAGPDRLAAYRRYLELPFDVVADPQRTLYERLGVERGTHRQVWSPGTLRMYARLVRGGRRLQRPTEDLRQLGADVVVGGDGVIRYLARPPSPDARPPIEDLVRALG